MATKFETLELTDCQVESSPLGYEKAEDLLPEIAGLVSKAFDSVSSDVASLVGDGADINDPAKLLRILPALSGLIEQLGGGKLRALAPRLLQTTKVTLTVNGEKTRYDLVKKEERTECFDARPDIYFQVLFFAGKVTFGRFFPASARGAKKPPALTTVA